jgi:hypothetical protein
VGAGNVTRKIDQQDTPWCGILTPCLWPQHDVLLSVDSPHSCKFTRRRVRLSCRRHAKLSSQSVEHAASFARPVVISRRPSNTEISGEGRGILAGAGFVRFISLFDGAALPRGTYRDLPPLVLTGPKIVHIYHIDVRSPSLRCCRQSTTKLGSMMLARNIAHTYTRRVEKSAWFDMTDGMHRVCATLAGGQLN